MGERRYDWQNKVRVQLTADELIQFTAVVYGVLPRIEFRNHGNDHNKSFAFERQEAGFFGKLARSGETRVFHAVPVTGAGAFKIAMLCLRQLRRNYPWAQGEDVIGALLRVLR